jgi:hypothetical protein
MLYTSCWSRFKLIPSDLTPVAICAGVPAWGRKVRRCPPLTPERAWLKLPLDEMIATYIDHLCQQDAKAVAAELGDNAVLLCWEPPGFLCHRRILADWFTQEMDIEVPELGFPRELIPDWDDCPLKGAKTGLPWSAQCDHCGAENDVTLEAVQCRCSACRKTFSVTW